MAVWSRSAVRSAAFVALVVSLKAAVAQQQAPLQVFWSFTRLNNAVVATAASIAEVLQDPTYAFFSFDSNVVSNSSTSPDPNAVPLYFYRNPTTLHTLTTASAQGIAFAAANGFQLQRIEGWTYNDTALLPTYYVTLEMWYSSVRGDVFLVGTQQNRDDAIAAGYTKLWDDCYFPAQWVVWPNTPPSTLPFPRSADLLDFEYAFGANAVPPGIGADTWYPSCNAELCVSTWADGTVNNATGSGTQRPRYNATTGYATILGDDPFNLTITNASIYMAPATPYQGRYPSANVIYNGVWYIGTYSLENYRAGVNPPPDCGNWCVQGPFTSFRYSSDMGATWTCPRRFMANETDNLFGEDAMNNGKVKFGAPHVVDFGPNMVNSPEPGMMYIVAHGATRAAAHESWMQGDQVYMARVPLSPETVNDVTQWQFYAGGSGPNASWSGNLSDASPLFTWENTTGVVTLTYVAGLGKYLMCVGTPTVSPSMVGPFDFYILESDYITGPWALVSYNSQFGPEAYFVNLPSKWQATGPASAPRAGRVARTGADVMRGAAPLEGLTREAPEQPRDGVNGTYFNGFLSYSADFASGKNDPNPPGSGYHWSLQPYRMSMSAAFAARLAARTAAAGVTIAK